jgi:hypothetical protein
MDKYLSIRQKKLLKQISRCFMIAIIIAAVEAVWVYMEREKRPKAAE